MAWFRPETGSALWAGCSAINEHSESRREGKKTRTTFLRVAIVFLNMDFKKMYPKLQQI